MFKNIYKYEIGYWLRNPLPYVFAAIIFGLAFLTMWGMSAEAKVGDNMAMMNSYYKINNMANLFSLLLVFVLPAIIGNSIFRDYKSRMYTFLYSFPFSKRDYLSAKFFSAFTVVFAIILVLSGGFLIGSLMPGVKKEAMLPLVIGNYAHLIFVFLLPNMLFFGAIVMALVVFTRNIYISFIGIIFLVIVKLVASGILGASGLDMAAVLVDPTGESAVKYMVRYWTLDERNFNALPVSGAILYNRLLWLAITIGVLTWTYLKFEFSQFASAGSQGRKSKIEEEVISNKVSEISLPSFGMDFSLSNQLKTAWHLSTVDFRSIVMSWPFITILFAGLTLVLFQQYQMGPMDGVVMIPLTANMLRVPMFFFSGVINLLTFLYVGVLMYKGEMSRMGGLIDISAQPDWVLMLSRLLAILKMQLLLLTLVMIGGMVAQVLGGYYRFELWHYAFELFILQGIHFLIWTCLALCMHSVSNNLYLGYFLLLLVPVSIMFMPMIANYLDIDILKENILHYNTVKGIFLGFDYSDFDGYGSQLVTYFAYKFYWLLGGLCLLFIGLLGWKRGLTFTLTERWLLGRERFQGSLKYATIFSLIAFVSMGSSVYYQEHFVSKIAFSDDDENMVMAKNEKLYGHLENIPQPQLDKVVMTMDIIPESQDFHATGIMTFVNKMNRTIDTIVIAKSFKENTSCRLIEPHEVLARDEELHYEVFKLNRGLAMGDSIHLEMDVRNHPNTFLHHNSRVVSNGTFIEPYILPVLGIRNYFITNSKTRKEYGLSDRIVKEHLPSDSTLLGYEFADNSNIGQIDYECTISTSSDQMAFTMGDLDREWTEGGRRYFHYKSNGPIVNTMSWMSGDYEKLSHRSSHQKLEMYRHELHDQNDDHMFHGLGASIDYCSEWFGALDYDVFRLVEFPVTKGTFATVNGNLIPYSESYFSCDVHDAENDVFNIPFFVSAHEIAHCWWGHNVDPANVKGGRMITEGMADYIAMKVVEQEYDAAKVLEVRKKYHSLYLEYRAIEGNESPLIHSDLNNEYLNYRKAALSIYAMSEYLGEEVLNMAMSRFENDFHHTEPPFATSLDYVAYIKEATPDSLQYLVTDMFENITLYDNAIDEVDITASSNAYEVKLDFTISKYNADKKGKRSYGTNPLTVYEKQSLPLRDYITIGFLDEDESMIDTRTILVTDIANTLSIALSKEPSQIVIDPNYLLIDVNRRDDVWRK